MLSELVYVHRLRADLTGRLAGMGPRAAARGELERWLAEITARELRLAAERVAAPQGDDEPTLPWWHR
jgi:hypothetical protein